MKLFISKTIFYSLLAIAVTACSNQENNDQKPNIIIIMADDLGWNDVGFHGSEIKTPNLDQLASQSLELKRLYSAPVCSPTRAGAITGMYPDRFNLRNHVYSPLHLGSIPENELFLPEMLAEEGYKERAAFGKWHLGHSHYIHHPNSRGFTYFYGHYNGAIDYFTHKRNAELDWHVNNEPNFDKGYSTDLIGEEAVKFIENASGDAPFFAYVAFNAPHSPMQAKEEDLKMYGYDPDKENEDYPVGGSRSGEREMDIYGMKGRGNTLRQTFSAMVTSMDRSIGNILEAVEEKGIEENTFIWFLSDNGGVYRFGGNNYPLRGAKHTEWEGGVRVVSLVKWPGVTEPGSSTDELIAYFDVFPTIEYIVKGKTEKETDGINVTPALKGQALEERYIFLGNSGIVSKKWKMNQGELFLIEEDISEENDISGEYPDIVMDLNERIKEFHKMQPKEDPPMQPEGWLPPENWTMPGQP